VKGKANRTCTFREEAGWGGHEKDAVKKTKEGEGISFYQKQPSQETGYSERAMCMGQMTYRTPSQENNTGGPL
jgi:hypothetical protein